jgi:hypothetical protein
VGTLGDVAAVPLLIIDDLGTRKLPGALPPPCWRLSLGDAVTPVLGFHRGGAFRETLRPFAVPAPTGRLAA